MRKRILHILNWNKYQARTDKELPWLKLWGRLFRTPWFQSLQDDEKFVTIALLDLARQFNNNIPEDLIFKEYLRGNYGVFMSPLRVAKLSQVLVLNDFLSDNCPTNVEVDIDKIRVDKRESNITPLETHLLPPQNGFLPPTIEEVENYFKEIMLENQNLESQKFVNFYESKGWFVGKSKMKSWKSACRNWKLNKMEGVKQINAEHKPRRIVR